MGFQQAVCRSLGSSLIRRGGDPAAVRRMPRQGLVYGLAGQQFCLLDGREGGYPITSCVQASSSGNAVGTFVPQGPDAKSSAGNMPWIDIAWTGVSITPVSYNVQMPTLKQEPIRQFPAELPHHIRPPGAVETHVNGSGTHDGPLALFDKVRNYEVAAQIRATGLYPISGRFRPPRTARSSSRAARC